MLEIYHHLDEVESRDGRVISCSHKSHPEFLISLDIWSTLHFVFVHTATNYTYTRGYGFRQSLIIFLDFTAEYNKANPDKLRLTSFTDLTGAVFSAFYRYILKTSHHARIATIFKGSMILAAEKTGLIPVLALPNKPAPRAKKTEPLDEGAFDELTSALKKHVDSLKQKIDFRTLVDRASPYDYDELINKLRPPRSRENIFRWYQHRLSTGSKTKTKDLIAQLSLSTDPEFLALVTQTDCLSKFRNIYNEQWKPSEVLRHNLFRQGVRNWTPDLARAVKTFLVNGYPFSMELSDLEKVYNSAGLFSFERHCDDVVKILLHRLSFARSTSHDLVPLPEIDDLLGLYFPTMVDMAALLVFIMLQSGWNKETVAVIDGDSFEHELSGLLNSNEVLIYSEKNRGQALNKPYFDPKQFIAYSDKNNPYSIYNLIILAKELSQPLVGISFDHLTPWNNADSLNPLFLCIRYWADWANKGGRHTSITNVKAFMTGVRHFLERYPVHESSRRITRASDFTRRLRPTWIRFHRKNKPLSLLTLIQGHAQRETTDIHYDSSGTAMQERRERLRSELQAIVELLRSRQFKGLLGKRANEEASAQIKLFSLPGKTKTLWGCSDQRFPSWPGAEQFVRSGEKCSFVNKCLFCSQIRLFEDSLPFLMERLEHLLESQRQSEEETQSSGSAFARDEQVIIQYILDNWEDEIALKEAAVYQRQNRPLLPRDLASLKVIFED